MEVLLEAIMALVAAVVNQEVIIEVCDSTLYSRFEKFLINYINRWRR